MASRVKLEKCLEQVAREIKTTENTAGIIGLNTDYPNAREIEEIRKAYFEHPDIEIRKKLIALRIALSKAFIANAQLNLSEARKELNKIKHRGSKNYLYGALAALVMFDPVNENYGVAGVITALFIIYMIIRYCEPSSQIERDEVLAEARAYFDECRNRVIETEKETKFFIDGEQHEGKPSEIYKIFHGII